MSKTRTKQFFRLNKFIQAISLVMIALLLLFASVAILDGWCKKLFPGQPYRQYFVHYFHTRVFKSLIVSPVKNVLFTRKENLATTKLPVFEMNISGRKLAALNKKLPSSGRVYQSGTLKINKQKFPARFRFKGDHFTHWKSKQKSWKVKLKQKKTYKGDRELNLVNPRNGTTMILPTTYYIARQMGLKALDIEHVHARLNGQYLGVLYRIENLDHSFIEQKGLPEGAIYNDEALGSEGHLSWEEVDAWSVRPPGSKQKIHLGQNPQDKYEHRFTALLNCLKIENDEVFFRQLSKLVDLDQYIRWWSHAVICSDYHQDRTHNNRLYLNPTSAKFQQIPWDATVDAEYKTFDKIDFNSNPITERLLQSPKYVYKRNEIVWAALHNSVRLDKLLNFIDVSTDTIREDIYADAYKDAVLTTFRPLKSILKKKIVIRQFLQPVTNSVFEDEVQKLRTFFIKRYSSLNELLSTSDARLFIDPAVTESSGLPSPYSSVGRVSLQVDGQIGLIMKKLTVCLQGADAPGDTLPLLVYGNPNMKEQNIVRAVPASEEMQNYYSFELDELLLPGRSKTAPFGPSAVRYEFLLAFDSPSPQSLTIAEASITAVHPLTEKTVQLAADSISTKIPDLAGLGEFQVVSSPKKIIWRGDQEINKDVIIKNNEILIVRPGTRVAFSDKASLLCYGQMFAEGTSEAPITFTRVPEAQHWGVVALQGSGADGSIFKNCIFEYGRDDEIENVFYSGALSIYNADASIEGCRFRNNIGDDGLNTKFSNTDVLDSFFISNSHDAYDLDFSTGVVAGNVFNNNGNDGIDCGFSHAEIKNNRILNCGDKGISVGERSKPTIQNNHIESNNVGIAIKDQSKPEIRNNTFISNNTAVQGYQKKEIFGGVQVTLKDCFFKDNKELFSTDDVSELFFIPQIK